MKSKFLLTMMILSLFTIMGAGHLYAQELPKAEVLSLGMTVVDEHYVMPNWNSNPVTDDLNVPVAMEFIALDTPEQAAQNHYAGYTTDFFITFSGLSGESITADDDCYLIGNYGPFGWIKIPVGGLVLGNNVTYPILTPSGFNFTYVAICESVVDFKCGIGISEAILTANPNMKVTLELGLSESPEQAQNAVFTRVGDAYTYDVRNLQGYVAKIGDELYSSVQEAIAAAADGATIELISSVTIDGPVYVNNKSVTIDLNGYEIVGTGDRMFRLNNDSKSGEREVITYRDGTIRNIEDKGRCIETRTGNIELVLDNMLLETTCKGATQPLTIGGSGDNIVVDIDNSTITSGDLGYAVIIFNPVTMTIDNSNITGWSAVYFKQPSSSLGAAGSVCTINNSTLRGVNKASEHPSNAFATIAIQDDDIEVNVTGNSTIVYADETNTNSQCIFGVGGEGITEQLFKDLKINVENGVTLDGDILGLNDLQQWDASATVTFPAAYANQLRSDGYIVQVNGNTASVTGVAEGEAYIGTIYYGTLEEAIAAANADDDEDEVVLLNDVTIESKIDVTKSLVLNGNNKTLTYTGSDRAIDVSQETNGADLTVKNLSVQFEGNYRQRGINYNTTGKLTLENVTVGSADKHPTYAVNLPGSCDNATIDVDGCVFYGNNTFNVWGEDCTITIDGTNITSVDNANSENYVAVFLNNDGTTSAEGTVITINGGSIVVATDENGNPSAAVRNNTETGVINISESTEIIGGTTESSVAIVYYNGTDNVYSCSTLQSAINKAIESNAAGVRLIKNVTSDEIITIDGNLNLDLNSKTVTGTGKKLFRITKASAEVTIKNGTIENNVAEGRCIETRAGGINLTLENLTLNTTGNKSQPFTVGGNSGTDGNVIVNMIETNVNAGINDSYAITTFNPVVMTIENSSVQGWAALNIKVAENSLGSNGSTFNINNSTLRGINNAAPGATNNFSTIMIEDSNITLNIDGNSSIAYAGSNSSNVQFIFGIGNEIVESIVENTKINVGVGATLDGIILGIHEDQSFSVAIEEMIVPAAYADQLRSEGYVVSEAVDGLIQVTGVAVAKIETTTYATLEDAFNEAQSGDEIVVLTDIILPAKSENGAFEIAETVGNVTLNLNGFDITSSERIGYTGRTNYAFDNYANLTIKGEGTITARGIQNYGTLTIEGNDVTIISNDELVGNGACIWGYQGSATIIKGGTFRGLAKGAGAINTEGSLEITGGTFSADGKQDEGYHVYTIQCKGDNTVNTISGATLSSGRHGVIVVQNGAELTINNVEATREGVPGQSGHVLYVADNGMLTINGGTFVNEDASAGSTVIYTDANSNTDVTDGTFTNQGGANVISGAGTTTLTGGNYSKDVTNYCATGYISQENEQGRWDVIVDPTIQGEAMIAGVGYETLEAAIAAANPGAEIVLLKDITRSVIVTLNKAAILNGNNKTLTSTAGRAINVEVEGNATIKNLIINVSGERGINVIQKPVNLTIDNVVVTANNYAVNLATSASSGENGPTIQINNSDLTGLNTINIAAPYTTMNIDGIKLTCNDQNENESYSAIAINEYGPHSYVYVKNYELYIEGDSSIASVGAEDSDIVFDPDQEIQYFNAAVYAYEGAPYFYSYTTLKAAIENENTKDGSYIRLARTCEGEGIVINKDVTIDFCGKTYTFVEPAVGSNGTQTQGFQILKDNTVVLKNGTLNVAASAGEAFAMLIQNYADLTITDMTLDGDHLDRNNYSYVLSVNCGNVLINGSTSILANEVEGENHFAFDSYDYSAGGYTVLPVVTVNTTGEIRGIVEVSATLNLEAVGTNNISRIDISGEGQLYHNVEGIQGTIKRTFENNANDNPEDDWYTIAVPFEGHEVSALQTTTDYALYRYNESAALWENVKVSDNNFLTLDLGRGYIYANAATTDFEFSGEFNVKPVTYTLTLQSQVEDLKGFHLIGNPFAHDITMSHLTGKTLADGFYVLSNDGAWSAKSSLDKIAAGQGALIKTTEEGALTIVKNVSSKSREVNNGQLMINVANSRYNDVAYVSFNKGIGLNKIAHRNAEIPMVYVPVNGENYAVATMSNEVTEIPVSFEAKTMGEYTISVEAQDCEFAQMYLIDKMTGYSTNLLLEDYTFMAKSGDNAERFVIRLVNSFDHSFGAENFIIFNDEEMMINDIQGEGVIRIVDVLGRPVAEYNVFGSANISTTSFRSGAYMIQVIDESGVKVQKIIID